MAAPKTAKREILSIDAMASIAVKRGRPSVIDGKIVDALGGLNPGEGSNYADVFGSVDVSALTGEELARAKGKIREAIRKHFGAAYPGETPTVRWTPSGEPLIARPAK